MLELILTHFPQLHDYIQLVPICFVGVFAGVLSYLQDEQADKSHKKTIKVILTSSFLTMLTYSILTATSLPYLASVGISAAVGYFGIDKAIEVAQKLIALRGSKENK